MSAESPRHARSGGPLTVAPQPPTDRSLIDAVSGFINDVKLTSSPPQDPKDTIQWARFETADVNEPTQEGESSDISPLLLILGYGAGVQVWLIPPTGEAQEVLSWRQGTVRVLRILPTPQNGDSFASKRPLIALCDSASPGPTFCSLSFLSIRGGEQVKSIKFKNPILDVLANKRSIVVSFSERFAVFDAGTLEDRMAVTTCYPCPCPLGGSSPINPLALGDRWLAYADKKINPSKRSCGGCEGEGVSSYTATVLHAAKSLGKGLRGLGESVAQSLAGAPRGASPPRLEHHQPGVVTVIDIEGNNEDDIQEGGEPYDSIVAHFLAHSEAIIALKFDPSGMLLITADRRGHDFHVFRIQPHPCGPSLAAVHHLYILHRGDTTSKVQDIAISADSRWVAISTLRGTTHIFPCSPYGGPCGVRTHTTPRVVNRLSRFHRSAGLPLHAATAAAAANNPPRSHSPQLEAGSPRFSEPLCYGGAGAGGLGGLGGRGGAGAGGAAGGWAPRAAAVTLSPLAQHRAGPPRPAAAITRTSAGRQRLSSLSEDGNCAPLLARACFGLYSATSMSANKTPAQLSLYVVSANGCLVHLALHPRPAKNVPKEKVSDESSVEVEVESVAQWALQRAAAHGDLLVPLPPRSPLLLPPAAQRGVESSVSDEERWLSQVEIVTHAGPHRRLWMGPQFLFKTYNCTGSTSSLSEAETVEIETCVSSGMARSNPVNMPGVRPIVPLLIDSGSASSLEHSPSDSFRRKSMLAETASVCDVQLREQLADAMKEEQGLGLRTARAEVDERRCGRVARAVGPFGTVVAPEERTSPPRDSSDPDAHTLSNTDETCFRPVLPTSALLPPPLTLDTRPLPRDTTIPVESMFQQSVFSPQDEPLPLTENTVIPAALGHTRHIDRSLDMEAGESVREVPYSVIAPVPAAVDPAPAASIPAPDISVPALTNTESVPDESDTLPVKSDTVPDKSDPIPDKSDSVPDTSDSVHDKSYSVPDILKPVPDISGAVRDISDPVIEVVETKPVTSKRAKPHFDNSSSNLINVDNIIHVNENEDLKANEVMPERECVNKSSKDRDSLPKQNRSDDIPPTVRIKKSPTPTPGVEDAAGGVSIKDNKTKERKENKSKSWANKKEREGKANKNKPNLDKKDYKEAKVNTSKNTDLRFDKNEISEVDGALKNINTSLDSNKSIVPEIESKTQEVIIDYNKGSKSGKDKKKYTSDITSAVLEPIPKNNKDKKDREKCSVSDIIKIDVEDTSCSEDTKLIGENVIVVQPKLKKEMSPIQKQDKPLTKEPSPAKVVKEDEEIIKVSYDKFNIEMIQPETADNDSSIEVTLKLATPTPAPRRAIIKEPDEVKTEEQAWDLLLNETEKAIHPHSITETIIEEPKSKTKKRRNKKVFDEMINRADDDNFVEIHTIEHKIQECSELVSITAPLEDDDIDYPPISKCKPRSPNRSNPESFMVTPYKMEMSLFEICPRSPLNHLMLTTPQRQRAQLTEMIEEEPKEQTPSYFSRNITVNNDSSMFKKDLIVIDSTNEDFPDIKIAKDRFKPLRKDDFMPEFIAKPPGKSWSAITAAKSKVAISEPAIMIPKVEHKPLKLPKRTSIQDKLFELYQRTDILIAECDTPSDLNFVDEHHTMPDLPPLEPLDFALDDFKLEVMRDSLLDISETQVMSPIRKISIDKILSSFKEPAKKALESSTFNLVGLKETADKSVKGFSIVESNMTTQEIDINKDKCKSDERDDVVEKSSDDDNTSPVVSTDSDKEEKKSANAVSVTMPSKEAAKPKKSRRKKK